MDRDSFDGKKDNKKMMMLQVMMKLVPSQKATLAERKKNLKIIMMKLKTASLICAGAAGKSKQLKKVF